MQLHIEAGEPMKIMTKRPWIIPLAMTVFLVLTQTAYATVGVDIEVNQCGLVISGTGDGVDMSNLNPGDSKHSQLLLVNEGNGVINSIIMKTQIIKDSELSPRGGALADALRLTIRNGDDFLVNDLSFREAANLSAIDLGLMESGGEIILDFELSFPTTSGNEYQGSSFQANWYFTASCDTNGGDPGGGDPGGGDPGGGDPGGGDPGGGDPGGGDPGGGGEVDGNEGIDPGQTIVPEGQVPQGQIPLGPSVTRPDNPSVIITVEGDPIPFGSGIVMPRTGESNPLNFVLMGSLYILLGMLWRKTDENEIGYWNEVR